MGKKLLLGIYLLAIMGCSSGQIKMGNRKKVEIIKEKKVNSIPKEKKIEKIKQNENMNLEYIEGAKWVEVTGEGILETNKTLEDVREDAINNARLKAIEIAYGVEVKSTLQMKNSKLLSNLVNLKTNGKIVKENIINWDKKDIILDDNEFPITIYTVKMVIAVKESKSKKDKFFNLETKMNKYDFVSGEKAELEIFSSKKAYITIFNIYGINSVSIILPNDFNKKGIIEANERIKFPTEGTSLELYCDKDKKESTEVFYIVGLKEFVDFKSMLGERTTIEKLNEVLLEIDDKAEAMEGYMVRNRK